MVTNVVGVTRLVVLSESLVGSQHSPNPSCGSPAQLHSRFRVQLIQYHIYYPLLRILRNIVLEKYD